MFTIKMPRKKQNTHYNLKYEKNIRLIANRKLYHSNS